MITFDMVEEIKCPYCNEKIKSTHNMLCLYDLEDEHTSRIECEYCGYLFEVSLETEVIRHYITDKVEPQPIKEEDIDCPGQEYFKFYEEN